MKIHTQGFKEQIKEMGRELDSKITYTIDNEEIELGNEELNSVTPHYQANILKSVMKQLDLDSNVDIPLGTIINYKFGVRPYGQGEFDYVDFGNYVVYSSEKQEDTRSYKIICYDKMLYSMKPYEMFIVDYPVSINSYIDTLCLHLGLTFKNKNENYVNKNKVINKELYLNEEGKDIGYTYRDVFDELAQVTASTIVINEETDEVEIRYINDTEDTINEEYLKDTNINFGEKYGPINSIVLSRAGDSDSIYLQDEESVEDNGLCEIKISENQIMNFNNRDEFLPDILEKLNGLEYYINDYESFGIVYYNVCDRYNVSIGDNTYSCIMFNDEVNVTQGLGEKIYCEIPEGSETDYTKADKTDRRISQTTLIVDKQGKNIEGLVYDMYEENGIVNENFAKTYQDIQNLMFSIQNSGGNNLIKNSVMYAYDNNNNPQDWETSEEGELIISSSSESLTNGCLSGHVFTLLDKTVSQKVLVKVDDDTIPEDKKTYYTFSTKIKKNVTGSCYVKLYNSNEEHLIELPIGQSAFYSNYEIAGLLPKDNYYIIEFYGSADSNATFTDNMFSVGDYRTQWTQANGEIMNTQVNINLDGVLVKSVVYEGDYTVVSPLEFAGYSNINGIVTKVFSLNKDTTEVKKLKAENEITMNPIKIVPVTTGDLRGWAFVPSTGGNNL